MFYNTSKELPSLDYGTDGQREVSCVASQMKIGLEFHQTERVHHVEFLVLGPVEALEFHCNNMGDNHLVRTLEATPFLFGMVSMTGEVGANFLARIDMMMMSV